MACPEWLGFLCYCGCEAKGGLQSPVVSSHRFLRLFACSWTLGSFLVLRPEAVGSLVGAVSSAEWCRYASTQDMTFHPAASARCLFSSNNPKRPRSSIVYQWAFTELPFLSFGGLCICHKMTETIWSLWETFLGVPLCLLETRPSAVHRALLAWASTSAFQAQYADMGLFKFGVGVCRVWAIDQLPPDLGIRGHHPKPFSRCCAAHATWVCFSSETKRLGQTCCALLLQSPLTSRS